MANHEQQPGRTPHVKDLEKRTLLEMNERQVAKDPQAYNEAMLLKFLLKEPAKVKKWADQGRTDD
jgi:hypothetical protein